MRSSTPEITSPGTTTCAPPPDMNSIGYWIRYLILEGFERTEAALSWQAFRKNGWVYHFDLIGGPEHAATRANDIIHMDLLHREEVK